MGQGWVPTPARGIGDVGCAPKGEKRVWLAGRDNGTVWWTEDGETFTELATDDGPADVARVAGSHRYQFEDTPQNEVWTVTRGGELWRFDGHYWRQTKASGIADVAVSPFGSVWVVRLNGTVWFTDEIRDEFREIPLPENAPVFRRIAVVPDYHYNTNTMWLAGTDGTLWSLNPSLTEWYPSSASGVGDVALGPRGQLWLAGTNGTIWYLDGLKFHRVPTTPDPRQVATLRWREAPAPVLFESLAAGGRGVWAVDRNGGLWVLEP